MIRLDLIVKISDALNKISVDEEYKTALIEIIKDEFNANKIPNSEDLNAYTNTMVVFNDRMKQIRKLTPNTPCIVVGMLEIRILEMYRDFAINIVSNREE